MDITWLETFVEIVNEGSFNAAAEKLFLSRSTVSIRMANLVKELTFDPFEKKRGEIRLTEKGEQLLEISREMLMLDSRIERLKKSAGEFETLRISAGTETTVHHVLRAMKLFQIRHPNVKVQVEIHKAADIIEMLDRGTLDIGFTWMESNPEKVYREKVAEISLLALFSTAHPLAQYEMVSMKDLCGYPLILRTEGSMARKFPDEWAAKHGRRNNTILTLDDNESVMRALQSGFGGIHSVGIVTSTSKRLMTNDWEFESAVIREFPGAPLYAHVQNRIRSETTQKIIDYIKKTWKEGGGVS